MIARKLFLGIVFVLVAAPVAASTDFVLKDLDGETHQLSDYRGKWVVVNYWATWCPPCREEMPELALFHEAHKDDNAVVLGVNLEDIALPELKDFVEQAFVGYPILRAEPAASTELGPVPGLPTTYIVSPEGEVVARQVGTVTKDMLEQFIERQEAKAGRPVNTARQ